jgi:alcohol dehydrogenase YqhD (iron-dependent ADH family)
MSVPKLSFGMEEGKMVEKLASETIALLKQFWTSIGAPSNLSDYNIDDKELDLMTERAMVGSTIGSYVPLTKEDVREILKKSL